MEQLLLWGIGLVVLGGLCMLFAVKGQGGPFGYYEVKRDEAKRAKKNN